MRVYFGFGITGFMCVRFLATIGLLLTVAGLAAQPVSEFEGAPLVIESFDRATLSQSLNPGAAKTIVVLGNRISLAGKYVSPLYIPHSRTSDLVLIAREIRIGPETNFDLQGRFTQGSADQIRAGDLYLYAERIVVDGRRSDGTGVTKVVTFQRDGASPPNAGPAWLGRKGRVHVFTERITYDDAYLGALVEDVSGGGIGNSPISQLILTAIAKSFSSSNPIHARLKNTSPMLWSELGGAYKEWMEWEPAEALVRRELKIDLASGDTVQGLSKGMDVLPIEPLRQWYASMIQNGSAQARAALLQSDYPGAAAIIEEVKPLFQYAPPSALAQPTVAKAINGLLATEQTLLTKSVVEQLEFSRSGAPPLRVTLVRDQAFGKISVLPSVFVVQTLSQQAGLRFGFLNREDSNVRLRFGARLLVDPSVLELVRARFPNAREVRATGDEIEFLTPNLHLTNKLQSLKVSMSPGNEVQFDLVAAESDFIGVATELSQVFGKDVSINWRHKGLPALAVQSHNANLTLLRGDAGLVVVNGKLINSFPSTVDVDYVMDGSAVNVSGFPRRLGKGEELQMSCNNLCTVPNSAMRHVKQSDDVFQLFLPMEFSSIQTFRFENQLEDNPARGGKFHSVHLNLSYKPSEGAIAQNAGPLDLGAKAINRSVRFLGADSGTLTVSGRAYWGNGGQSFQDLIPRKIQSGIVIIDKGWLPP